MAFRITKLIPNITSPTPVTRKHTPDVTTVGDRLEKEGNKDQYQQHNQQEQKREFTKEELEKAVKEMEADPNFTKSGLHAEIITTKDGVKINLTHASGNKLRSMSAEEFLKMRESAHNEDSGRGKILDQKF